MNIKLCSAVCSECGFSKSGTTDTLHAEAVDMINRGVLFPCHLYLKSQTGSENTGTETLDTVEVCRGYVAFMKKYGYDTWCLPLTSPWPSLLAQISDTELDDIYTLDELIMNHIDIRNFILKPKDTHE